MKNKLYLFVVLFLFSFINLQVLAQNIKDGRYTLTKETKIRGSKIFYEGLKNQGDESQIDVSKIAEDNLQFLFKMTWSHNPLFEKANDKASADVIVGGYYIIKTGADIEEKIFYETTQNVGGAIPFYEIRQTNRAEVMAVISYTYKDNSVDYDTISYIYEYERKPKTEYESIEDLLAKCTKSMGYGFYDAFHFHSAESDWYNFKSVKTKDKELKEQLKTVNDLLKNGEINKAGSIYLKAYELDNSNLEAAFNVAMCYELIGNYPKANEFYLKSPDFHAKVRMKSNMIFFDYINKIGANVKLVDF